jgi:hypothetical protein
MNDAPDAPPIEPGPHRFSLVLMLRTLAGLILAPTVGGAIILGGSTLFDKPGGDPDVLSMATIGAYIGFAYGIVPALLIGWPIHLILLHKRWTHPLVYIGLGAGIGISALFLMGLADGAFDSVARELDP